MTEASYRAVLSRALEHALSHLERLDTGRVGADASLDDLRTRFAGPMPDAPSDPTEVVDELVRLTDGGVHGSAGGRFFGWVIGGSLPAALAADWLTSAWDNNATLYATGPAAAVAEETCGRWLKALLGIPDEASFALTTGCQMSHVVALASARQALLGRRGWDADARGLFGAPPMRVLASTERHGSVGRAARLLGLGRDALVDMPVDVDGCLTPDALARALEVDRSAPTIVVLNAGDLNVGAFDPFDTLIPLARRAGAWVHVDGAFGLWLGAAPARRALLRGVEEADSWATDGHKVLNVPFDCGYVFVRDAEAHRRSFSYRAAYLSHEGDARDPIDWTPEWSRRARSFATYAALRELGRDEVGRMVEGFCRHARTLVERIGRLPGAELVRASDANQGLVRFLDERPGASERDHDGRTDAVLAAVNRSGEAFFTGTTWRGRKAMRVSVCNWQTDDADVARAVAAVERALARTA